MIEVRCFARYRGLLGFESLSLPLPEPPTVAGLLALANLAALPAEALVAVNRTFAAPGTVLVDGDEVALMPPVSGG